MFVVWQVVVARGDCTVTTLQNFPEAFAIRDAVSVADRFPDDAFFAMNPQNPKDIRLPDQVRTYEGLVVVSSAIRDVVLEIGGDVELLPVAIHDHRGRVASSDYWIVNPLTRIDCLDVANSRLTVNAIDNSYSGCDSLAILPDRVPEDATFFRPSVFPEPIVCRRDVADRIVSGGFSGIDFVGARECII